MQTNRLAQQKSPYLLRHAGNPVDWYPWGQEAFERARSEDKPIFLSVGYSTCHWCHVMEHESFNDPAIAALLNQHFIPIKVDREERPDVDRVYMLFVQATTGGGGWPMSVFLTPELEPFFGGTYFPPENRYGLPGFGFVLQRIAEAWREQREEIVASSRTMLEGLREQLKPERSAARLEIESLERGFQFFRRAFDPANGGFGGAPKFPQPSILRFLLREYARTQNLEALDMALDTLRAMAAGSIRDQLGGGFHRYSVDEAWLLPHFEKMLYDQAQLARVYLEAFQLTREPLLAGVARETLDYVLRDMTGPEGEFYSAEDADSPDPDQPAVLREGAFYLWRRDEIEALLGPEEAERFCQAYGVTPEGNLVHDPTGEFVGKNVLYAAGETEGLEALRARLLEARLARPRPVRDDKIVAAWNGLMISAFASGARVLGEPRYLEAARRAAAFALTRLRAPDGSLYRCWRAGEASVAAFSEDYSCLAQGLLDLYEAGFEPEHLNAAVSLTEKQLELFEDTSAGGLFSAPETTTELVLRLKDDFDGAEPSSNSVAALNLSRLAHLARRPDFAQAAERIHAAFAAPLESAPGQLPELLSALAFHNASRQIVISGERGAADTAALLEVVNSKFQPFAAVMLGSAEQWPRLGQATAYVCRDFTCLEPTTRIEKLAALLEY